MRTNAMKAIGLGLALLLPLSACTPDTVPDQTASPQRTQVTMMHFNKLPTLEALVEHIYDDIDLVVEQNASATLDNESERRLKNGHGSDLIMTTLPGGAVRDYTYDLSAEDLVLNYSSAVMKTLLVDGQTHYVPLPGQYYGYVVNKTLVEELGFDLPQNDQQILAILQAAKDKGVGVGSNGDSIGFYNIGESYLANQIFGNYVPDFLALPEGVIWLEELQEGKATFSGHMEPAMDLLLRCIEQGYFDPGTNLSSTSVMTSSKNAVHVLDRLLDRTMVLAYGSTELYQNLAAAESDDEFTMIPFLSRAGRAGWLVSIGNGYLAVNQALAAPGQEQKLDATLRVLALLSTEKGQRALMQDSRAVVSYLKADVGATHDLPADIRDTVDNGYVFDATLPNDLVQYFGRQMSMVIAGRATLSAAMSAVDNYNRNGLDTADQASTIVGQVASDLLYANYNTRREETALGDLIADAVRHYTGAEIALVNGGGIRSSLYAGDVWDADLAAVCPYNNKIITVEATGEALRKALANGISQTDRGRDIPGGRFLQVSGLHYTYRPMQGDAPSELLAYTLPDGSALDDRHSYLVAITDYMAGASTYAEGNGDGYVMFNVYDDTLPKGVELVTETGGTYRDALKSYFAAHPGQAIAPTLEGRITVAD
ncbi:MAG: 5'-nucleotidase C-terminal domain-containing protein [Eubacteriales bacterium]|nr:5'-nucleotidase C-terminal domain-containing protein [Eubacteriales bacterium]